MLARQRQWAIAIGCGLVLAVLAATTIAIAQEQSTTLQMVAQNNSGISGTATFTPSANGLTVDLKVTGAGPGPEPAHIHPGTCAQLNPTPEFTLASVTNGTSTTNLQTTLRDLVATPHAIHMHKSVDEVSTYVACADINPTSLPRTGQAESTSTGVVAGAAGLTLLGMGLLLRRRAQRRLAKVASA
jgi:LPXTG-motif cell wall-anchored protein